MLRFAAKTSCAHRDAYSQVTTRRAQQFAHDLRTTSLPTCHLRVILQKSTSFPLSISTYNNV